MTSIKICGLYNQNTMLINKCSLNINGIMSKTEKCKNSSDIRIMIKENELKPLKGKISKEEYNRIWLESREKSETR